MRLTIYSKPGCHLCDVMKDLVRGAIANEPDITLEDIDISTNDELLERYGLEIPVLMIEGRKVAKYRISREELRRLIENRRF